MRRPAVLIAAGILASLAATRVAPGDPAKPSGKEDGEALEMSADQLDLDVEAKTAQLTGHVRLARGAFTLRCPRVDVRYDQVPHVTWARGSGGVVAEVKGVKAEAPEVEVDLAARTMDLHGGVRLSRGEGWITAERASINIATGKVSMSDVKGSIPVPSATAKP
jgi:lipopolysaccharide export system protein LptA